MVRATNSVTATEDELADLQRRFHLLEGDRKAFYEASQWTIKQNKETLELVKEVSQPGDFSPRRAYLLLKTHCRLAVELESPMMQSRQLTNLGQ